MELTICSKILDRSITFSRPGSAYIYADLNGLEGTLGRQICHGGGITGSAITYTGQDENQFNAICRSWYRAYVRGL